MTGWLLPAIGFILLMGAAGITTKMALKTISWQQLVYWVPISYIFFSIVLGFVYGKPIALGVGGAWAIVTAACASGALILFFLALTRGEASIVVPATSVYPVITLIGSAVFLSENITVPKVVGTLLIVAGVIVISR